MKSNYNIRKSTLICFLLLLPFFEPQYFKQISWLASAYVIAKIFAIGYCVLFAIIKKRRISSAAVLVIALQLWFFCVTYFNGQNITSARNTLIAIGGIALVVDLFRNHIDTLLRSLMLHFELCVYVNFATLIFMRNGLYSIYSYYGTSPGYFLGYHHLFITWFFPGIVVAWLCRERLGYKYRCWIYSAVVFLSELIFGINSTGFVAIALFLLCMVFPKLVEKFGPLKLTILSLLVVVLVVFLRFTDFLEPIVMGLLGETDMTFTGRTAIWDNAIDVVLKRPLVGYGVPYTSYIALLLANGNEYASHCHNHILQILFQGGLAAFALFAGIFVKSIKRCVKKWNVKIFRTALVGIAVFIIMGMTEPFEYALMYLVVLLPFYLYPYYSRKERKSVGKRYPSDLLSNKRSGLKK